MTQTASTLTRTQQVFGKNIRGALHDFPEEEIIYEAEKTANTLCQVVYGRVAVYIPGEKKGEKSCLRLYGAGDYFGEECLGPSTVRWGTAEALDPSRVMIIPGISVREQCENNSELAAQFMDLMWAFAQEERILAQICMSKAVEAIAKLLLHYGDRPGLGTSSEDRVCLEPLPHHTIAAAVGTTRESATQMMNKLRREGRIEYSRAGIVLKSALREMLTGK